MIASFFHSSIKFCMCVSFGQNPESRSLTLIAWERHRTPDLYREQAVPDSYKNVKSHPSQDLADTWTPIQRLQ